MKTETPEPAFRNLQLGLLSQAATGAPCQDMHFLVAIRTEGCKMWGREEGLRVLPPPRRPLERSIDRVGSHAKERTNTRVSAVPARTALGMYGRNGLQQGIAVH
jgi:hypothetical protein